MASSANRTTAKWRRTAAAPAGITFQPKWQITLGQIQTAQAEGVPRAPVVAGAGWGDTTAHLLSHYFAFIGHIAIPALAPRFALAPTYRTELTGLLVAEPIWHFLDALEGIKRDTFPSGHISAALISVHYIFRFTPRPGLLCPPCSLEPRTVR